MRKAFRILGAAIGVLVLTIVAFCAYVALQGIARYDPPVTPKLSIKATPALIQRGENIAQLLCIQCHANEQNRLTGKRLADVPAVFGTLYSANITQDPEAGIGRWTDGELLYFLRTGVRPDGSYSVIMPKFPLMATEDAEAVIAWLRSDRYPVQPTRDEAPASEYSFVSKLLSHTVMGAKPYSPELRTIPDSTDEVAFGRYVANELVACYACHSADFTRQDPIHPELSMGFYGGGNELVDDQGKPILSSNLTFDEVTGIGRKYTKAQFVRAVKLGVAPNGSLLRYPMTPHTTLTDYEAGAIYEYLKTIPKLPNDVARKSAAMALAEK